MLSTRVGIFEMLLGNCYFATDKFPLLYSIIRLLKGVNNNNDNYNRHRETQIFSDKTIYTFAHLHLFPFRATRILHP